MKFFKTLLAATLGSLIAFAILIVLCGIILVGIIAANTGEPEPVVSENTVLTIEISGNLPALALENPFEELFDPSYSDVSLKSIKENLAKAAADDNIEGVLLEIDFLTEGWANLQEAHRIITTFRKESDKFVYAMTNDIGYNEKGYYLATAADSVFSPPHSFFEFDGFYTQVTFFDQLFEMIGIEPEIARHGEFKAAVEPFYRTELSEPSELQLRELIENVNGAFLQAVTQKTNASADELNALLNEQPHLTAQFGSRYDLIDSLLYPGQVKALIEKRIGMDDSDSDESFETISNNDYARVSKESAGLEITDSDAEIAVIYASGIILPRAGGPFSEQSVITAGSFRNQLEEIKEDGADALVVRINSPGGSGSTSDLIWEMLRQTAKDIPVIASMGPVAASGGYYIAMAADTIVAQPTTITGSIGVFATKFNAKELFNEELGITYDEVKSHPHADWLSFTRGFTPSEAKAFQQFVDGFYQTFITKVAGAREMSVEAVDEVAGGRVWSGEAALERGLVDVLGGLDKALAIAAEKAGIENYETTIYPEPESLFEMFMGSAQTKAGTFFGRMFYGKNYLKELFKPLSILQRRDPLLLYPYEIKIQ